MDNDTLQDLGGQYPILSVFNCCQLGILVNAFLLNIKYTDIC